MGPQIRAVIELQQIAKTYNTGKVETPALLGVDLTVTAGEFVAIMGPSGSGKSTMMHIMGLLDRASGGHYLLEGQDVTNLSDDRLSELRNRKMGFVFQAFHLLHQATAVDNVLLPFTYGASYPGDAKERAVAALEKVGLGKRLDHRSNELSGGECQRVAIARALVTDPELIFADEPTGNLDGKASEEVMGILDELNQQGKTIILVTHDAEVGERCRRMVVLTYGRITEDRATRGAP